MLVIPAAPLRLAVPKSAFHPPVEAKQHELKSYHSYLQIMQLLNFPTYTGQNFIWKSCSWPAGMVPLGGSTENTGVAWPRLVGELRVDEVCSRPWPSWPNGSFTEATDMEERERPVGRKSLVGHLLS